MGKKENKVSRLDAFAMKYPNSITWKLLLVLGGSPHGQWAANMCRSQDRQRFDQYIPSVYK